MARRTRQAALETRSQIIDAAELCFYEKGVSQTSLAEIAKTAGVTRGAIYWHFNNKGEVVNALLTRIRTPIQHLDEACREVDEPDPLGRLHALLVVVFQQAECDPPARRINEILFHKCEYSDQQGDLREHMRDMRLEADQNIMIVLSNAINRGQLPNNLDVPMAARCLHSFIAGTLDMWLLRPEDYSLAKQADRLALAAIDLLKSSPALLQPDSPSSEP